MIRGNKRSITIRYGLLILLAVFSSASFSTTTCTDEGTFGWIACQITMSFTDLARLITASSYLAGLGFSISSILKFKQHKDNPTQVPIGTPIALFAIAASLLFLPSILGIASQTMFGAAGGTVATPLGTVFR